MNPTTRNQSHGEPILIPRAATKRGANGLLASLAATFGSLTATFTPCVVSIAAAFASLGCGPSQSFRVRDDLVLAPNSRWQQVGKNVVFSVQLPSDFNPLPACTKKPEGDVRLDIDSYNLATVTIANPSAVHQDFDAIHEARLHALLARCGASVYGWYFSRFMPTSLDQERRIVALTPGMRLRIDRASGVIGSALMGVGDTSIDVVGRGDAVYFSASTRLANTSPGDTTLSFPGNKANTKYVVATVPSDLNPPAHKELARYWWLIFPNESTPSDESTPARDSTLAADRHFVFAAATVRTRAAFDAAFTAPSTLKLDNICIDDDNHRCVVFPGHAQVTVEIPIVVQEQPRYVPLGTTVGDVIARDWARGAVSVEEIAEHFQGQVEVWRSMGVERIPFDLSVPDWLDVPVAQGDLIQW